MENSTECLLIGLFVRNLMEFHSDSIYIRWRKSKICENTIKHLENSDEKHVK